VPAYRLSDSRGMRATLSVSLRLTMFILAATTVVAGAQVQSGRREMVGFIRDSAGTGIEGATVQIAGNVLRTDPRGSFRLWAPDLDTLTIVVHRVGFEALEALLTANSKQWDTVVVELNRVAQNLAGERPAARQTRRAAGQASEQLLRCPLRRVLVLVPGVYSEHVGGRSARPGDGDRRSPAERHLRHRAL
jgi:hypothetical protein